MTGPLRGWWRRLERLRNTGGTVDVPFPHAPGPHLLPLRAAHRSLMLTPEPACAIDDQATAALVGWIKGPFEPL